MYSVCCRIHCQQIKSRNSQKKKRSRFTSDSSWERVSKLLHVFSLCFCLVLLSSEDNLNGTLRKKKEIKTVKIKEAERKGQTKNLEVMCTLAPMTATSAVGQA